MEVSQLFSFAYPVSSVVSLLIETFLVAAAISLSSAVIAHRIEFKRIIIMAVLAYFLTPLICGMINVVAIPFVMPLLIWIVLGEVMLKDIDVKKKAMVAILAYVIFLAATLLGLQSAVISLLGI